jgi:hypothetical protein
MRNRIKQILKEEESDFDWVSNQEPTSKDDISKSLRDLGSIGDYSVNINTLVDLVHGFGLTMEESQKLSSELYDIMYHLHGDAHSVGYAEGYDEAEEDCRYERSSAYDEGHDEGYDEGERDGYSEGYKKGHEEGVETTYTKAFEEGRAYEVNLDTEEYEKREGSPYDPNEYDDDYNTYN